jgi:hypothetical protein
MNVTNIKKEPRRIEVVDVLQLGIQSFGADNIYPQRIREIASASGTASSCIDILSRFVEGQGFKDVTFYQAQVNLRGTTNDALLSSVCKDIANLKGFALHANYNLLAEITEVQFIPFENCRLGAEDDNGFVSKIAIHGDWQRIKRRTQLKGINKQTVDYIDVFNPIKAVVQSQILAAGGIEQYKGQVLWVSFDGEGVYPKPVYDPVITDISSEAGLANVNYRNIRFNFLPAGMLVRKKASDSTDQQPTESGREQEDDFTASFKQFQGDENACKIIDVEIEFEEEAPTFVPFAGKDMGKEFAGVRTDLVANIGNAFKQPAILRGEAVSTGLTTDAMKDAYNFYNSITSVERRHVERIFKQIFERFHSPVCPSKDYSILPLKYATDEQSTNNV